MSIREGLKRLHVALAALFGLAFVTTVINFRKGHGGLDALLVWAGLNIVYWAVAWVVAGFMKDKDQKQAMTGSATDEAHDEAHDKAHDEAHDEEGSSDTDRGPPIARVPQRTAVANQRSGQLSGQRSGRAVGQWTFLVRCECGKRWFEVKEIDSAKCPRCGLRVYIDREAGGPIRSEPKNQQVSRAHYENPPGRTPSTPKVVPYIDISPRPGNNRSAAARYPKLPK